MHNLHKVREHHAHQAYDRADGNINAADDQYNRHTGSGYNKSRIIDKHVQERLHPAESLLTVNNQAQNIHHGKQSDRHRQQEVIAVQLEFFQYLVFHCAISLAMARRSL